jgi:hypothetical protein
MVDNWFHLGFVVDPGTGLAVETERTVVCRNCYICLTAMKSVRKRSYGKQRPGRNVVACRPSRRSLPARLGDAGQLDPRAREQLSRSGWVAV